tara:strand:- start:317 stop:604 length:288 start_codon:yes stop_codon:yes gene_type:complete
MQHKWTGRASGEQEITITFTVKWKAIADCITDSGNTSGPPENCYPPEAEAHIVNLDLEWFLEGGEQLTSCEICEFLDSYLDEEIVYEALLSSRDD